MEEYTCKSCGYVYDPALGDPDRGVEAGMPFEAIADDWVCPQCGAAKVEFEPENEAMPGLVVPVGE